MKAWLKQRRVRDDVVELTVHPCDGRYPEKFKLSAAEMRRFCWATLADLDPDEAAAAAADDGFDLSLVSSRVAAAPAALHQVRGGTKKWRILQAVAGGARTLAQIAPLVDDAANPSALLTELRDDGYLWRTNSGGQGVPATWELTEAARKILPPIRSAAA